MTVQEKKRSGEPLRNGSPSPEPPAERSSDGCYHEGVRPFHKWVLPSGLLPTNTTYNIKPAVKRLRFSFGKRKTTCTNASGQWSGLRGSNSLPPPWQGGALPDELNPHIRLRMPTCVSTSGHQWSGLRGSNSLPPPWQGGALPDELNPHFLTANIEYQKAAGKSSLFFDFFEKFTAGVPKYP